VHVAVILTRKYNTCRTLYNQNVQMIHNITTQLLTSGSSTGGTLLQHTLSFEQPGDNSKKEATSYSYFFRYVSDEHKTHQHLCTIFIRTKNNIDNINEIVFLLLYIGHVTHGMHRKHAWKQEMTHYYNEKAAAHSLFKISTLQRYSKKNSLKLYIYSKYTNDETKSVNISIRRLHSRK